MNKAWAYNPDQRISAADLITVISENLTRLYDFDVQQQDSNGALSEKVGAQIFHKPYVIVDSQRSIDTLNKII